MASLTHSEEVHGRRSGREVRPHQARDAILNKLSRSPEIGRQCRTRGVSAVIPSVKPVESPSSRAAANVSVSVGVGVGGGNY